MTAQLLARALEGECYSHRVQDEGASAKFESGDIYAAWSPLIGVSKSLLQALAPRILSQNTLNDRCVFLLAGAAPTSCSFARRVSLRVAYDVPTMRLLSFLPRLCRYLRELEITIIVRPRNVTEINFAFLPKLKSLEFFSIEFEGRTNPGLPLTDNNCETLAKCPSLRELNLSMLITESAPLSAASLAKLGQIPTLSVLRLPRVAPPPLRVTLPPGFGINSNNNNNGNNNGTPDRAINGLGLMTSAANLHTIALGSCNNVVSDSAITQLANLPALRTLILLELDQRCIGPMLLAATTLPQLRCLELHTNLYPAVYYPTTFHLLQNVMSLTLVRGKLPASAMESIGEMPCLERLVLREMDEVEDFKPLGNAECLSELDLRGNRNIVVGAQEALFASWTHLRAVLTDPAPPPSLTPWRERLW